MVGKRAKDSAGRVVVMIVRGIINFISLCRRKERNDS